MTVPLSAETRWRLEALFSHPAERERALAIVQGMFAEAPELWSPRTPEGLERIRFAVLKLSQGRTDELQRAVDLAHTDWRDALMAADFGEPGAHARWRPRSGQRQ